MDRGALHDDFWKRLAGVQAGMLHTGDGGPESRWVPMSHHADREAGMLWFITAEGTDATDAAKRGGTCGFQVADNDAGLFAQLTGQLAVSNDRAKLEELWDPVADAWFEEGIDDPDLRLLSYRLDGGEVWLVPTSGIRFLFSIARAQVTGTPPDMGEHFNL